MTDTDDTTRTRGTDDESTRTGGEPTRADGRPMKMKEMDHAPPLDGPNRTFERGNEGQETRADGGQRTADDAAGTRDDEEGRFRQKMKNIDHTPPVEGPGRTFERGDERVGE